MKKRHLATVTSAAILLMLETTAVAKDSDETPQYVASFTCGLNPAALARIVPGTFATTIQIHNPGPRTALLSASALFTFPSPDTPGGGNPPAPLPPLDLELTSPLAPGAVTSIDCADLLGAPPPPYVQGVVVINSNRSLDVRQVLTAAGGDPLQVTATATEIVPERRVRRDSGDDDD